MSNLLTNFKQELKKCKNLDDVMGKDGLIKQLTKLAIEHLLQEELGEHLGYEKNASRPKKTKNARNGYSSKTVKSDLGPIELDIPRDREGSFETTAIKPYQRDIGSFHEKIISMYAKGMTTRDIEEHVQQIYGYELSAGQVSIITNKIMAKAIEWQNRPLMAVYAVVYFDAIHYKVRHNNKIVSKAAYTCLAITPSGHKEILGIWIGENEGAAYWLSVINELKNRGVQDILIACMDGLKGLPDAIKTIFPQTETQLCIVHMIRNSMKFVANKKRAEFIVDLKKIYQAFSEEEATFALDALQEKWGNTYKFAVKPWVDNWEHVSAFFKYPAELRKMIYTTNAVEAVHRQFRKVTKTRSVLTNDESLFKILYLASEDISSKWKHVVRDWPVIIAQLHIIFKDRLMVD